MSREQMIIFLQTIVVFLLMTNAVSALTAMYAIWVANGSAYQREQIAGAVVRKAQAVIRRVA